MNTNKPMGPAMVWLFALGAIALGAASGFVDLGSTVGLVVYFAIFAAAGFAATYLTSAKRSVAILAMVMAAFGVAIAYYFIVGATISEATSTLSEGVGASADQAAEAGGIMGIFMGIVAAIVTFGDALVAGVAGCIAGARFRVRKVGA